MRYSGARPGEDADAEDLEAQLGRHGHLLPLPKEPAALANVLEVSIVNFLLSRISATDGQLVATRGGERFYPDLEISGPAVGGAFFVVDIKVAQRKITRRLPTTQTQSRITLYTGNTYFAYPQLHWPGTFRPFAVPQVRPRLFIIGPARGCPVPELPEPTHTGMWERRMSGAGTTPHVTAGEALAGLASEPEPSEVLRDQYAHLLPGIPPGEKAESDEPEFGR